MIPLQEKYAEVLSLANGAGDVIRARADELAYLRAELEALDGRTCGGVLYWRREGGKPARLYVNHSIDAACPMHGTPAPGGRLRCYIGSDPDRIAEARAAIERETQRADLERQASIIQQGLVDCELALLSLWLCLAGELPKDDEAVPKKYERRTSIERAVAEALDQLGVEHIQQYRVDNARWIFDEFIPPRTLIEVNGDYWHGLEKTKRRDARKANWAMQNDYWLVTIWEHEIKNKGAITLINEILQERQMAQAQDSQLALEV